MSTTQNAPEYEYGAYYTDITGHYAIRAIRASHRAIIEWIAEQPNAESYGVCRRRVPFFTWHYDGWQER